MISVNVFKQSNYPVGVKKVRDTIKKVIIRNGVVSDTEISVAIVGKKSMDALCEEYFKGDKEHSVLSFPDNETKTPFCYPPDNKIYLGDIVISYPLAIKQANEEGKLIDETICELAEHATMHLMGIHHD